MSADRTHGPACEWHEERISRTEDALSGVAVQMAGMGEQLKHVAERLGEVGKQLSQDITRFREATERGQAALMAEVEALKSKNTEQDIKLAALLVEHDGRARRFDMFKKAVVWGLVAVLGAIATSWGEALYQWFTKSKG